MISPRSSSAIHALPGTGPYGIRLKVESVRRSWIVVSSLDDRLVSQASTSGADVIVLDLEDSVHALNKPLARAKIRTAIPEAAKGGSEVFVRPDIELIYADLEASVLKGVTGVVLSKVESAEQVQDADRIITKFEQERAIPEALEIHLSLETAKGNFDAMQIITSSSRVRSVSLGRADLVMDLRGAVDDDLHMLPFLGERLVLIARVAGVAPIGAFWKGDSRGTVASPEATLKAATRGMRHGFKGAMCWKVNQVPALDQGFTPSDADVQRARAMVQAFEGARAEGKAWGTLDSQLVSQSLAEAAKDFIRYAEECLQKDRTAPNASRIKDSLPQGKLVFSN